MINKRLLSATIFLGLISCNVNGMADYATAVTVAAGTMYCARKALYFSSCFNTMLLDAAEKGQKLKVQALLLAGANVNFKESHSQATALHNAAGQGYEKVAQILIAAKANVHLRNRWKYTPLDFSVYNNHLSVTQALIDAGARVNDNFFSEIKNTHLMTAAENNNKEMVSLLLKARAFVDEVNSYNKSALHFAAKHADPSVTRLLLEANASPAPKTEIQPTPKSALHDAASHGNIKNLQLLIAAGGDINGVEGDTKRTPLLYAADEKKYHLVRYLINYPNINLTIFDRQGHSILSYVVEHHKTNILRLLLQSPQININEHSSMDGEPLLHSLGNFCPDTLEILLTAPEKKVNQKDVRGKTPLHNALILWDPEKSQRFATLLLAAKANPFITDNEGINAWQMVDPRDWKKYGLHTEKYESEF